MKTDNYNPFERKMSYKIVLEKKGNERNVIINNLYYFYRLKLLSYH